MVPTTGFLIENGNRCTIPWLHTEINLQNNQMFPCCKYEKSLGSPADFKEVWFGKDFNKLRNDILNNTPHKECVKCAVPDTEFSYKNYKNSTYKKDFNIRIDPVETPRVFHFSLKNICNLACRMCGAGASSKIASLIKDNEYFDKLIGHIPINNHFDIGKLSGSFTHASQLTFTGGEPLLDNDCLEIIKMAGAESNRLRTIAFSTNMTIYNHRLVEELKKLNVRIIFNVSIDGPKIVQEYIRAGSSLDTIIENIKRLQEIRPTFGINSTISVMNVGYITELVDTLHAIEQQARINFNHIMTSPVLQSYIHARNVPLNIKQVYRDKLLNYKWEKNIPGQDILLRTALELLEEDGGDWNVTEQYLREFDLLTKTNYLSIYPEFGADGGI